MLLRIYVDKEKFKIDFVGIKSTTDNQLQKRNRIFLNVNLVFLDYYKILLYSNFNALSLLLRINNILQVSKGKLVNISRKCNRARNYDFS